MKKFIIIAIIVFVFIIVALFLIFSYLIKSDVKMSEYIEEFNKAIKENDINKAHNILGEAGKRFILLLFEEKFWEAYSSFDFTMGLVMPPWEIEKLWRKNILDFHGLPESVINTRVKDIDQYILVFITCKTANSYFEIKLVFSKNGKISGLWCVKPNLDFLYKIPDYVNIDSFSEEEYLIEDIIFDEKCPLPAILTLPKEKDSVPAIILVHGSGPSDKDESIGPNKPFKDLAWGIASQGIAVLRYDKRSLRCQEQLKDNLTNFTINEESVFDTISAVKILKEHKQIDNKNIFVLGHSLGGMIAPRIATMEKNINGLIILAGNTRNLADISIEQIEYLYSLKENPTNEEIKQVNEIKKIIEKIKKLDMKDDEILMGASKSYWKDILSYNPVETAKTLNLPMLVLQGERDYQVTMEDFKNWKTGLSNKDKVSFISYSGLNHLFHYGEDKSNPKEYNILNNIDIRVIRDIVDWIKNITL